MEIAGIYRDSGIEVCALGVFTSLIESDGDKRQANLEYFERHLEYAAYCGIPVVSTECGFDPASRGIRADLYEARFSLLVDSLGQLCTLADRHGVDIALEPCVLDVVPSAKRMADTIAQVGSPRLKVLLDPANLIANSSEKDMFDYLAPHIAYFHGKDRKVNDAYGRVVGDGDIDWPLFLRLYHERNEGSPFILEYAKADNCAAILNRVKEYDKQSTMQSGR
jgi:sugar phosphate isomerase/epimerase